MGQEVKQNQQSGLGRLLARVLVLGISAQILLGIFWILLSFSSYREYGESLLLLSAKESLVCDEWQGILYVLLMKASGAIAGLFGMPWYCPLYAVQLLLAGGAAHVILGAIPAYQSAKWPVKLWTVLAMVTFPAAAQCHLAVLPISLASSVFLASLGVILRCAKAQKKDEVRDIPATHIALLGVAYLIEQLLWPKFGILGALLLVLYAVYELLSLKKVFTLAILTAVFLGLVPVVFSLTVQEGAHGRTYDTVEAAALRRYAWHDLIALYPEWSGEMKESFSQDEISLLARFPEELPQALGKIDAKYGKEQARSIYGALAKTAHRRLWRQNAVEIAKDLACYAFAPASDLVIMRSDRLVTLERRNLESMRRSALLLATVFVTASGWCFLAMLLIGAFLQGKELLGKKREDRVAALKRCLPFWILSGAYLLYVTYQGGGITDAKAILPVTAFWMLWGIGRIYKTLEQ